MSHEAQVTNDNSDVPVVICWDLLVLREDAKGNGNEYAERPPGQDRAVDGQSHCGSVNV